jgi:hypothetical protein
MSMSTFASLEWYATVSQTINQIYREELNRDADFGGWANWLYHAREGGRDAEWIRARIRESEEWHAIHDAPPIVTLPRLVPTGAVFRLDTGARFTAIECTDFNLLARYLVEGAAAIGPVLQERQALGFNMLRVWAAFSGDATFESEIGRLVPSEHPEIYDQLPGFCSLCAAHGLYVELTAFTAGPIPGHWENLGRVLPAVTNVIVELVNENNAHPSDNLDTNAYQPLPGVICSHGSNGSEAVPPRPAWDYETFHTNDAFEWWRKGGHNGMELSQGDAEGQIPPSHKPVIANENTRPDRDRNPNHHQDAAAAAALLIAGSCFHSVSGKKSALLSAADRGFAEAFVRGARSVNVEFQEGRYVREEPGADLRVYSKVLADGRRETVRIRK